MVDMSVIFLTIQFQLLFHKLSPASCTTKGDILNLEIISIIPNRVPNLVSLQWTGAALQTSVETARRRFATSLNISLTLSYNDSDRACVESEVTEPILLAEYYNTRAFSRCVAVVAAACGGILIAPFLVKEWDVLLLANSFVSYNVFNPVDAPTSVSMPGTIAGPGGIAMALLDLFENYGWYHVTLLMDSVTTTESYRNIVTGMQKFAESEPYLQFRIDGLEFSSDNVHSVDNIWRLAMRRSRDPYSSRGCYPDLGRESLLEMGLSSYGSFVKLILTLQRLARIRRVIVNFEDFIFINYQPAPQIVYGAPALFDKPSLEDEPIFRSVLYMTTSAFMDNSTDADALSQLNKQLAARSKADYGTVLDDGLQPLDLYMIRETYNSAQIIAEIVNESRHDPDVPTGQECAGRMLRKRMANRSFPLMSGPVTFNAEASRSTAMALYTYKTRSSSMTISAYYVSGTWQLAANSRIEWQTGSPPLDIPLCGFTGFHGPCASHELNTQAILLIFFGTLVSVVVIAVLLRCVISKRETYLHRDTWWKIIINPANEL